MTIITEKTKISIEVRHMLTVLGTIILSVAIGVGGYFSLTAKIESNIITIKEVKNNQQLHIKDYKTMNNIVIKNHEQLKSISKTTEKNAEGILYLIKKANNNKD